MRSEYAQRVYPVLLKGLELKDRVLRGERPKLLSTQTEFKRLLGSDGSSPWGSAGDVTHTYSHADDSFLGMRYPLAAWLDEIFCETGTFDSLNQGGWNENKLELSLFNKQLRDSLFWRQAALAEGLPEHSTDTLEAFLLCTLLGFRGEKAREPERLRDWVSGTRNRIAKTLSADPPVLAETAPESYVPPLTARAGYERMWKVVMLGVLVSLLLFTILLVDLFLR
jgi:type IV/VI secretion system ImpK/VasF family protein